MAETINGGGAAAMALVAQVERQAASIVRSYDDGNGVADSYAAFRDFTERLDQFHVFVALVEGKLGNIAASRRDAQAQMLMDIRWRMMMLEIDAMQGFMTRFLASGKPWPLGSQKFLDRREARLDEIIAFQQDGAAQYGLVAPDEDQIASVRGQFTGQSGLSLPLDDFSQPGLNERLPSFDAAPEDEPAIDTAPEQTEAEMPPAPVEEFPIPPAIKPEGNVKPESVRPAALPKAPPGGGGRSGMLKKKKRLAYRVEGENVYLDGESAGAVEDACKQAGISMDELAKRMGLGRSTLVLMLKGADAIERKPLNQLRVFVSQNGGLV